MRRLPEARTEMTVHPLRLNLGAGLQQRAGWINYDRSRSVYIARSRVLKLVLHAVYALRLTSKRNVLHWPAKTRVRDLTRGIPHAADSVDAIYSSHMLEHVHPEKVDFLLRECHRVLKPGGVLRVVVPDLEAAIRAYVSGDRQYVPSEATTIGDAFVETLYLRPSRSGGLIERAIRRVLRTDDGGHAWMYDTESLVLRVQRGGFQNIQRVSAGEGRDREAAQLDSRSRQHIHLEAFKPA